MSQYNIRSFSINDSVDNDNQNDNNQSMSSIDNNMDSINDLTESQTQIDLSLNNVSVPLGAPSLLNNSEPNTPIVSQIDFSSPDILGTGSMLSPPPLLRRSNNMPFQYDFDALQGNSASPNILNDNGINPLGGIVQFDFDALQSNSQLPDVFDVSMLPPPLPLLQRSVNYRRVQYNGNNHYRSKSTIVNEALSKTSEFIDKISSDYGEHINIIIVTFNDNANIYSTIPLTDDSSSFNLIHKIQHIDIKDLKTIIINNLIPNGSTNFFAVNQAHDYLNGALNKLNGKKISYLMSDGEHSVRHDQMSEYGKSKLYDRSDLTKNFDFSLGIGQKSQYDEALLKFYGNQFIAGNSSEIVHDSIIGDTFGCTTLLDEDVEINIYASCDTINSNHNVVNTTYDVKIDTDEFKFPEKIFSGQLQQNLGKINGTGLEIKPLNEDLVFIFYVDVSHSMCDDVLLEDFPVNPVNRNLLNEFNKGSTCVDTDKGVAVKKRKISKSKSKVTDDNDVEIVSRHVTFKDNDNTLNKFTLSKIGKFNTYDEVYFGLSSPCDDVYVEIVSKSGITKFKLPGGSFTETETILSALYFDILEDFNNIMDLKEQLDTEPNNKELMDKIKSDIADLGLKVGSSSFNIQSKRISKSTDPSRLEIYYLALISHITKLVSSCKKRSERLLDQMANTPLVLQRSVSSAVSRQYSTPGYSLDCTQSIAVDDQYDMEETDKCNVCYEGLKEVVYDCGHCLACKKCTKHIFFNINEDAETPPEIRSSLDKLNNIDLMPSQVPYLTPTRTQTDSRNYEKKCPVCRADINNAKIINHTSTENVFKCITDNCTNKAYYLSSDCSHLTYCSYCWKINKKEGKLICKCGQPITNYCKIY